MNEVFEFEYNALQEMLIVNHQDGFSYNMSYEDDVFSVATKLNNQQATIEMYKRSVDKREEQICIIKKYCLKFLTDEQFKIIRKALEDE